MDPYVESGWRGDPIAFGVSRARSVGYRVRMHVKKGTLVPNKVFLTTKTLHFAQVQVFSAKTMSIEFRICEFRLH